MSIQCEWGCDKCVKFSFHNFKVGIALKWKDNISNELTEMFCEGVDSTRSVHGEMTGFYIHSCESLSFIKAENFVTSCTTCNTSS